MNKKQPIDSRLVALALLRHQNRLRIALAVGLSTSCLTGCTLHNSMPSKHGRILIDADAKGMQAFGDVMNGMITNGKASADKNTAHWQLRKKQAREETVQQYAPSFLGELFGTQTASVPMDTQSNQPITANKEEGVD